MKPAVQFHQVSKKYILGAGGSLREMLTRTIKSGRGRNGHSEAEKAFWALKDVSFSIDPGESLGLIGPNGAGKTTALKILADIVQPTSGKIEVNGRTSALIELGAGFHPDLTGRENIYLYAAILGLKRREVDQLFDRIVDFSELEHFIDTPVKRYSSGMYVRLAFAVAAHVSPDVLLVDEVLAVGDSAFRLKCARRIDELQRSGATIIFVSHNLYLVKSVCNSALFLADGKIQAIGDKVMVINEYERWLHNNQIQASHRPDQDHVASLNENSDQPTVISIDKVALRGPQGYEQQEFCHSDHVKLEIHYTTRQTIPEPQICARINRDDGTTCCMVLTNDYGYQLDDLHGQGIISISLNPLLLAGGSYFADVEIWGSLDGVPLALGHSSWFAVNGRSFSHEEASGVFVPQVTGVSLARLNA